MVMMRPPGIRIERGPARVDAIGLLDSGVPVFLGLAERGPTNEPVRLTSTPEFFEVFGHLDVGSHLAAAVDGFFLNGGNHCFVVRIAHLFERAKKEIATKAAARLRDVERQNTLLVQAISEGMWGNALRVAISVPPPAVQTFITVDAHEEDSSILVKSTYGFARGTLIKIYDDEQAQYRVLQGIDGRSLVWNPAEPLGKSFRSSAPTMVEPVCFDLTVQTHHARETFRSLNLARQSPQYAERVINGSSRLITVTNLDSQTGDPSNFPVEQSNAVFEGGTDGLYTVAAEDFIGVDNGPGHRYGLAGIAEIDEIDLVVLPDLAWAVQNSAGFKSVKDMEIVQQAAISMAEERRDRMCILDFPPDTTPAGALQWRRLFDSSYAAFYYPYLRTSTSPNGAPVPTAGHVAGVFARCDAAQGVYRAPANEELQGVVDLAINLQPADIGRLNHEGINCLQIFANRGIRIWGARTASSDLLLRYVNVRRTISAIARALQVGTQWVVFENNDSALWSTIERDVRFFLDQLWQEGYLRGASSEEAFWVTCDDSVNSNEIREKGQLVVELGVAPFRPSEFIGIRVVQEIDVLAREDGE